jgi:hypothetical protein
VYKSTTVKCVWCGWRSRRKHESCECDWPCYCTGYGHCPKCSGRVQSIARLREMKEHDEEVERWMASDEGRAALATLDALPGAHAGEGRGDK